MERKQLSEFSTKELSDELKSRSGVRTLEIYPHADFKVDVYEENESHTYRFSGPAVIHVNQD